MKAILAAIAAVPEAALAALCILLLQLASRA